MIPARLRPENAAAFKHFVDSKIIIVQKWQKQNKTNRKTKYKPYYWNVSRAEVKYKYRKKIITFTGKCWVYCSWVKQYTMALFWNIRTIFFHFNYFCRFFLSHGASNSLFQFYAFGALFRCIWSNSMFRELN